MRLHKQISNSASKVEELQHEGYCVLKKHFAPSLIGTCREKFWPVLLTYLNKNSHQPNRGVNRHFLPMPFEPPCFVPDFFFDKEVLGVVQSVMGDGVVADQWGCDVPVRQSNYQEIHVDFHRPLFFETPDLLLPVYMLIVSFGLVPITSENGAIEIAACTHRMPRNEALSALEAGEIEMRAVTLEIGDVLIRHPWTLHRGTPNFTDIPRALVSIRYVRHWYTDHSREVNSLPPGVWKSMNLEQRKMMRFPLL